MKSKIKVRSKTKSKAKVKKSEWFVYMVRCVDKSLYTGITTDVLRRVNEHNGEEGARYTRSRTPVVLVYKEKVESRSVASKREIEIKKMKKTEKERLLNQEIPRV